MSYFKERYYKEIQASLMKDLKLQNIMEVPKLQKITLNVGLNKMRENKQLVEMIFEDLKKIAGQHPVYCAAKKSNSNFGIREGMTIGVSVTLRGENMYEFLARFIITALANVKDFSKFSSKSFDGNGNYSFAIREHQVFREVSDKPYDFGFSVTLNTSAKTDMHCLKLLECFGFMFDKKNKKMFKKEVQDV